MLKLTHYNPNVLLSKYIKKITLFKSKGKIKYSQPITPTPYSYLMYIHKSLPMVMLEDEETRNLNRLNITGPKLTKKIIVEYNGIVEGLVFELNASAFYYLFHTSPSKLTDSVEPLSFIVNNKEVKELYEELRLIENTKNKITLIEDFFIELSYRALPFVDYIEKAIQIIEKNNGTIPINEIAKELPVSAKQFSRKFKKIVGISPKQYSLAIQFLYILKILNTKRYSSIQDVAYKAEFYDLSHFARTFKELTGFKPADFINSNKHLTLKYFDDTIQ